MMRVLYSVDHVNPTYEVANKLICILDLSMQCVCSQESPLASERAPDTTRRTVVARKQMESLRQQLQFLCIRLQEDLAQCILR